MSLRRGRSSEQVSPNPRLRSRSRVDNVRNPRADTNAQHTNEQATQPETEGPIPPEHFYDSAPSDHSNEQQQRPQDPFAQQFAAHQQHFAEQFAQFAHQQQTEAQRNAFTMEQMMMFMHNQFERQMAAANEKFERLLALQGDKTKSGDPPRYSGKLNEDLELWIFRTEEYYQSKKVLMEEDSSAFVTMISSNLNKTVMNWYREFSAQCDADGINKTWPLFTSRLRARFRPKDFEYNLRERLFELKQTSSINEYVAEFQDMLAQTEIPISELEKRFYFQNGLRSETARKIKEESPSLLKDAIAIATNFEFAHFQSQPPHSNPLSAIRSHRKNKKFEKPTKPKSDWKKSATCNKCGIKGHIAPECKKTPSDSAKNNYMSGSIYASLEVKAEAITDSNLKREVSIFVDNGCSLNGVSEEVVNKLQLEITEDPTSHVTVDLGFDQTVQRLKRTVKMSLLIPGFPILESTFMVMPIPEGKDVILGMMWLREQNPIID